MIGLVLFGLTAFAALSQAATVTYVIAHFPFGAGWSSRVLVGAGASGATVDISFFSQSGTSATVPLESQGSQSALHLTMAPNSVQVVGADPSQRNVDVQNVTVTWAMATSSAPLNVFTLFDYAPSSVPTSVPVTHISGSVGAQSMVPARAYRFPVSAYGILQYNAGVAVANANATSTSFVVTLMAADGSTKGTLSRTIPGFGQTTFILADPGAFGPAVIDPTALFNGSVGICASQPVGIVPIGVEGSAFFTISATNDFPCP